MANTEPYISMTKGFDDILRYSDWGRQHDLLEQYIPTSFNTNHYTPLTTTVVPPRQQYLPEEDQPPTIHYVGLNQPTAYMICGTKWGPGCQWTTNLDKVTCRACYGRALGAPTVSLVSQETIH